MAKTITSRTGIASAKMRADGASIVKAMIIAPKTMNGERSSRRSVRLRPVCTWFMSLVMRVIIVDAPSSSSCVKLSDWMCA